MHIMFWGISKGNVRTFVFTQYTENNSGKYAARFLVYKVIVTCLIVVSCLALQLKVRLLRVLCSVQLFQEGKMVNR